MPFRYINSSMPLLIAGTGIGCGAGFVEALFIGLIIASLDNTSSYKELVKFSDKVDSVMNSNEIDRDTFTVTDVNRDKYPEIILYDNEGNKIVLDINNRRISKETKTLDEL